MSYPNPARSALYALALAGLCVASACGQTGARVASDVAVDDAALTSGTTGSLSATVNRKACLDVVDRQTQAGARVQLWECHNAANQTWKITDKSVTVYGNMCLTTTATTNNAAVIIAACNSGDAAQAWHVNGVQLIHDASGRCLDVRNGGLKNGTRVQIYDCAKGNVNQSWVMPNEQNMVPVQTPPAAPAPAPAPGTVATGDAKVTSAVTNPVTFGDWGINGGFTAISLDALMALHPKLAYAEQDMVNAAAASNPMVPPQLLVAICLQESSGGQDVGSYGGPFQFTDDRAWNAYGPPGGDRNKMGDAAKGAANYIAYLLKQNGGDLNAALRFYNGPIANGGKPSYQADIQAWMKGVLVYGSGV